MTCRYNQIGRYKVYISRVNCTSNPCAVEPIHYQSLTPGKHTVAQKTVQMFACFGKIELVLNADIILGPDFLSQRLQHINFWRHFKSCDLDKNS